MSQESALSLSHLCNMAESELRTDVLIPLFKAMGFQDVHHHHGVGEKGKDIVMWMPTPLDDREYYAVVVKAAPITGQATTGGGNAGEVFTQINQALGSRYTDPSTLQLRKINKCWVVTSHAIKREASEALRAALGNQVEDGIVTLIGDDRLWQLLERHTPARTVGKQLQVASCVLNQMSPDYDVEAVVRRGTVQIGVVRKHPNAKPLRISAVFEFPPT